MIDCIKAPSHFIFTQTLELELVALLFVAVFLGCTSTGRVGLCFLWFFVQELPKAQLVALTRVFHGPRVKNINFMVLSMNIIKKNWVSLLLSRNFQVIHNVPMEAHTTKKIARMLYGDDMFLTTILLELSGAVNGQYCTL